MTGVKLLLLLQDTRLFDFRHAMGIGNTWIFLFKDDPELSIFGGVFGYEASIWLISACWQTGTVLLLVFILVSFLIIINLYPILGKEGKLHRQKRKNLQWR